MSTLTSLPRGGTPMATAVPPQSSASMALRSTAGCPTQSNAHVTPPGPSAPATDCGPCGTMRLISSTASPWLASTKSVAPNCRAKLSLPATVSTATTRLACDRRRPWMTFSPTPPTPKTAAVCPGSTVARLSTAPTPVSTPQPMRHADVSGTSLGMGTAWISDTIVCSVNTEVAAKFDAGSPSYVKGVDTLPRLLMHMVGCPVLHARQTPQLARVAITTWSPGFTERTRLPTASTTPAPSWPRTDGAFHGMVPSRTDRSEWHTPAAATLTFTSVGPGSATSSLSVTSARSPVYTIPRIRLLPSGGPR